MAYGRLDWERQFGVDWQWTVEPRYGAMLRLIDEMLCGVIIENDAGMIEYANRRLLEWGGYEPADLEGQPVEITIPEELRGDVGDEREAVRRGDFRTRLSLFRRKDGRTFPVAVAPQRMTSDEGRPYIVALLIDLAEVQTARPLGAREHSIASDLAAIAARLQAISFSAAISETAAVPADHPILSDLSVREREILERLVSGSRVPAIAKELFISQNTVRNHLKAIFRKVDVSSQSELIERVRSLAGSQAGVSPR